MKTLFITAILLATLLQNNSVEVKKTNQINLIKSGNTVAATYKLNALKSSIKWTGYAGVGTYAPTGSINIKSGSIVFNNNKLLTATVIIDMKTIKNENKELEDHLKNNDFFDTVNFPTAVFKLYKLKENMVSGYLTIKNITQKINFPVTITQENGQLNLKTKLKIDRTLFNIKYNSESYFQDLGNYAIKNEFELEINLIALQ